MSFNEMELDIQEIFNEVTANSPKEPNSYPLHFEMSSLKEIFEFFRPKLSLTLEISFIKCV
jgi:hypothetical protein